VPHTLFDVGKQRSVLLCTRLLPERFLLSLSFCLRRVPLLHFLPRHGNVVFQLPMTSYRALDMLALQRRLSRTHCPPLAALFAHGLRFAIIAQRGVVASD
jgi:hypothetical protein